MLFPDPQSNPLLNLTKYAKRMGLTTRAVRYQLAQGRCLVAPIAGARPVKWRVSDVEAFLAPVDVK